MDILTNHKETYTIEILILDIIDINLSPMSKLEKPP